MPEIEDSVAELRAVTKLFRSRRFLFGRSGSPVRAVDNVSLTIRRGRTLGLVGESGSGKSTVARLISRLTDVDEGEVWFDGEEITRLHHRKLVAVRRRMQFVFQDPYSSLDPMSTVGSSIAEPLRTHSNLRSSQRAERVQHLLDDVGLLADHSTRYPQELSGGQLQRIAIARALAVDPELVVMDEPVSSLDVSTRAEVINVLLDIQQRRQLAFLFIAHDLGLVRHLSDEIAVMYLGKIVELGPARSVYEHPLHPYTQLLLSSIPMPDPRIQRAKPRPKGMGEIPSAANPPSGCRFRTRCIHAMPICEAEEPNPFRSSDGVTVLCHLHTSGPVLNGRTVLTLTAAR